MMGKRSSVVCGACDGAVMRMVMVMCGRVRWKGRDFVM